jgi:hypothetical protein
MQYYAMVSNASILLPVVSSGENSDAILTTNLHRFSDIDYDMRNELISERLKNLMNKFLTRYDFLPFFFVDTDTRESLVFWRFRPPVYEGFDATFRNDGIVSHIAFDRFDDVPIAFTVKSPRGVRSIVVRLAVAESALRRSIFGVDFLRVTVNEH